MKRLLEVLSSKRRYHERKKVASWALRALDVLLLPLPRRIGRALPHGQSPRRILLMNPAYNGDLLLSTSVLPELRRAFPGAEIGMLCGSWARQVVEGHPDIARIHILDLARLNRAAIPRSAKVKRQKETRIAAVRDIKAQDYDLAIDLFTGFPPVSWLAWQCGIPRRVGYSNHGFGVLLTEPRQLDVAPGKHETEYHLDLVRMVTGATRAPFVHPSLPVPDEAAHARAAAALGWPALEGPKYVVIHPGSGERLREWPEAKWKTLIGSLIAEGRTVILTGHGAREAELIGELALAQPGVVNLCGRLDWKSLAALFSKASLLIGIESMSGHLASAWQVPTITLHTGMADPVRWRPANRNGVVLHTAPPCLPCLDRAGCATMTCIRDIEPAAVGTQARKLLEAAH